MKELVVFLVAGSLLSIVFFGFLAMTGDLHDMARCFAVALQGKECPESAGFLAMGAFHIDVLKIFSIATLAALALLLLFAISFFPPISKRIESFVLQEIFAQAPVTAATKEMHWLERRLHSPTFL